MNKDQKLNNIGITSVQFDEYGNVLKVDFMESTNAQLAYEWLFSVGWARESRKKVVSGSSAKISVPLTEEERLKKAWGVDDLSKIGQ